MGTAAKATYREPWNKGKIVGQKAPFKLKDIWELRVRLQMENRVRELAPCERLVAHSSVAPAIKEKLTAQFKSVDPVRLLQEIRKAQQTLSHIAAHGMPTEVVPTGEADVAAFLQGLSSAWKAGEARPTHRKQPKAKRWWRTRVDPFADAWPVIEGWLNAGPR